MRHPETFPAIDRARTRRARSKLGSRALGALAALLIGASSAAAQETPPTDLRPAAPTAPEQPATPSQTSPRVLTTPAPAQPATSAQTTPAPAQPAAPTVNPPSGQAAPAAAPAPETAPAAQTPAAPAPSPASGAAGGEPVSAPSAPSSQESAGAVAAPVSSGADEAAGPETAGTATLPHDLSPWGMFMAADIIVKSVMLGLAFASVVTWTIWLAKALELFAARMKARRALRCLERATTLQEAVEAGRRWPRRGPVAALAQAALLETQRSGGLGPEGRQGPCRRRASPHRGAGGARHVARNRPSRHDRLDGALRRPVRHGLGHHEIRSSASARPTRTNLAVVAPGIAEALLATAIGLVAAIPAVIIYNVFARSIAGYRAVLADASAEVLRHLSRDLDRRDLRIEPGPGRGILQAAE